MQVMRPAPFSDVKPKLKFGDKVSGEALISGHFQHAGHQLNVGLQGDPWTVPCPSERFATWLHSFHWFEDLAILKQPVAAVRARFLVDGWIAVYGSWNRFAWESYLNRGLDWLDDEIELQILPDGGHVSRSPEMALKALV